MLQHKQLVLTPVRPACHQHGCCLLTLQAFLMPCSWGGRGLPSFGITIIHPPPNPSLISRLLLRFTWEVFMQERSPSSPDAFCFSLARLFQPQAPVWTARTAARAAPAFPCIVLVPPATSTRCLLHQLLPGVRLCPVPPPVPILLPAVGRDGQACNRVVCIPQSRRNGDISQRAGRGELFQGQLCCSGGGGERKFLPNPSFGGVCSFLVFFFFNRSLQDLGR